MRMGTVLTIVIMAVVTRIESQAVHWDLNMYQTLSKPEEIEKATTVNELRRYLSDDTATLLQWMALTRITEIGGEEAVTVLYDFYQSAEGIDAIDIGIQPKTGAVWFLGSMKNEKSKQKLLSILNDVLQNGPTVSYGQLQLSPLGGKILRAAISGLASFWEDQMVYEQLRELSSNPPEPLASYESKWAKETLLRIDMKRAGIDTLPVNKQVEFLLDHINSAGFGEDTFIDSRKWTEEAVLTEAVAGVLISDYGSQVLPIVDDFTNEKSNILDKNAEAGIEYIKQCLQIRHNWEKNKSLELKSVQDSLNQPGKRLMVRDDEKGKSLVLVPKDH